MRPTPAQSRAARPRAQPLLPGNQSLLRSTGQPLDSSTKAVAHARLGRDFSDVRVHTGNEASRAATSIGAKAFTVGRDIVLGATAAPNTASGQRLLAHELAHVAQPHAEEPSKDVGARHDADERQADRTVNALGWGGLHRQYGSVAPQVTWHASKRPPPALPARLPAGALIQRVQLTYDDGPDSAGNTRLVLDALNAAGARATFYLVGKRVAQGDNWRIVFDIAAAGHWLGNHAYDWNDQQDEHIFLKGTVEERAQKILQTEWAIRDALIQGRDDARKRNAWDTIPAANRAYIEDVIAHGTGRFRTPGFRSKTFHRGGTPTPEDATTGAAVESASKVLAATGLRPLSRTYAGTLGEEGVDVDPKDWQKGRTKADVESGVKDKLSSDTDSILLHSRIAATAAATPAVVADIQKRQFHFDATPQGQLGTGSVQPKPGFAGLKTISDPPTSAEIAQARAFLRHGIPGYGPVVCGSVALGVMMLAQRAGKTEVDAFVAEIKATKVQTPDGPVPLANWLNANEEWRLFSGFFENWMTNAPFPRIKGVTL